jgi:hypothetical protein
MCFFYFCRETGEGDCVMARKVSVVDIPEDETVVVVPWYRRRGCLYGGGILVPLLFLCVAALLLRSCVQGEGLPFIGQAPTPTPVTLNIDTSQIDELAGVVSDLATSVQEQNARQDALLAALATRVAQPLVVVATVVPVQAPTTAVPSPTAVPTTASQQFSASSQALQGNGLEIVYFDDATDQMRHQGATPWGQFGSLRPNDWTEFPNEDNAALGFSAAQGLEYAKGQPGFCSADQVCTISVPPQSYVLISGDWRAGDAGCNGGPDGNGCALLVVNVSEDKTAEMTGTFFQVYLIEGLYFDGDSLPQAINAGLSHTVYRMTNTAGPNGTNEGLNCSRPQGCDSVDARFLVVSGSEPLVYGAEIWSR